MLDRLKRFLHYLLSVPFFGFAGTLYFNHLESSSSNQARFGYDAQTQTLDVHYTRTRALYRYHEVSIFDVLALLRADRLQDVFNTRIVLRKAVQHLTYFPPKVAKICRMKGIKKRPYTTFPPSSREAP